jgi:ectoine hydroxylase-related dioxygenase (phytanoyl-CoA dioxygenase family)
MNLKLKKEELSIYGFTCLGKQLKKNQIDFFYKNLIEQKKKQIKIHGKEKLNKYGELEFLRNCSSFHENYIKLIEENWLNDFINEVLNEKAIMHGYHGIITSAESKDRRSCEKFSPMRFHRDCPWFKDTRTCVLILMPLIDFNENNGPTEYVASTHLFKNKPSDDFLENNSKKMIGKAGTVFAMDGATYHRAGINKSNKIRPMLQMNWTLAFMKQQIELWHNDKYEKYSDLAKSRLGYNVRTYKDPAEMFCEERKWKSGNYTMENTNIHE